MSTTHRRTFARACTGVGAIALGSTLIAAAPAHSEPLTLGSVITGLAAQPAEETTPAQPATPAQPTTKPAPTKPRVTMAQKRRAFGLRAVKVASSRKGSPYSYGAAGPRRFDCSGLTQWTFKRLGKRLPHSSSAQYSRVKHISRKNRMPGDLVFFRDGGGIYHVAIYAGKGKVWHAPYSGTSVRKDRIWTSSVSYGRVRMG